MTGPDHYKEAERLLDESGGTIEEAVANWKVAKAQVHATLALTAATAEPIAQSYDGPDDTTIPRAWSGAIS